MVQVDQKVISLSSAESELHCMVMVGGCYKGIFIKNCLQFVLSIDVDHYQFTGNSAARQLISRQGVGRIRHLSGKLLWKQSSVMNGEVFIHQVPAVWNYSDVGTKSLPTSSPGYCSCSVELEWLKPRQLSQLDWKNTTHFQSRTQIADWKNTTHFQSRTQIAEKSAMAKTLKRITLLMSAQGFGPSAAEAVGTDNMQQCPSSSNKVERYEGFWMWIAIFALLALWFLSATWQLQGNMNEYVERLDKAEWDIYHCWNQVADEDNYICTAVWKD